MAAPRVPKAPKAPKAPKVDPKKAGDKAKKQAKAKAKAKAKAARKRIIRRVLFIVIPLLIIAIVALVVWLVMFGGPGPSEAVQKAIDAAFIEDEDTFKTLFTDESVSALESAWSGADIGSGATRGSWKRMMRGILTREEMKPKIVEESVDEGGNNAEVSVDIDGIKRTIHLVKLEDSDEWKIDVNLGINPNLIIPPEAQMDEEIAEEFRMEDPENEMWWEGREAEKAAEKEKEGCLGCSTSATSPLSASSLLIGLCLLGLWLGRRRLERGISGRGADC